MARPRAFEEDAVLDRAMRLFWRQGYEATSVQDLVAATGLNRASLYNAFGDKHSLFLAAIERYLETVSGARLAALEAPGPALPALRRYFDDLIAFSLGEGRRLGCLLTNSAVELSPRDPLCEERLRGGLARVEDTLYRVIRRGQRQGEIATGRDPRALARFLLGLVQGLRVMARLDPQEDRLRDLVTTGLDALAGGGPLDN